MIKLIKNYCCRLIGKLDIVGSLAAENLALRQQLTEAFAADAPTT